MSTTIKPEITTDFPRQLSSDQEQQMEALLAGSLFLTSKTLETIETTNQAISKALLEAPKIQQKLQEKTFWDRVVLIYLVIFLVAACTSPGRFAFKWLVKAPFSLATDGSTNEVIDSLKDATIGADLDKSTLKVGDKIIGRVPGTSFPVTSEFGPRIHPVTGEMKGHGAVDVGMPTGTQLYVPVVIKGQSIKVACASDPAAGNYASMTVIVEGQEHYFSAAHLSKCQAGEYNDGAVIPFGLSGNTGRSTGPHLHWVHKIDGTRVDPWRGFLDASIQGNPILLEQK